MEEYVELTWKNLDWILKDLSESEDVFEAKFSKTIASTLDVPEAELLSLWSSNDTHNSNMRVREMWKYGTSIGISGTPAAFVNGVKLDEIPMTEAAWKEFFNQLLVPATEEPINLY